MNFPREREASEKRNGLRIDLEYLLLFRDW